MINKVLRLNNGDVSGYVGSYVPSGFSLKLECQPVLFYVKGTNCSHIEWSLLLVAIANVLYLSSLKTRSITL